MCQNIKKKIFQSKYLNLLQKLLFVEIPADAVAEDSDDDTNDDPDKRTSGEYL